jgi:two-component system response regulator AlgR
VVTVSTTARVRPRPRRPARNHRRSAVANVRDRLEARFGGEATIVSGPVPGGYSTQLRMPILLPGGQRMRNRDEDVLRTMIVDDEPLAIERMQVLCAEIDQLAVIGTASDGEAALRLADKLKPDLLLLDMTMPGLDGLAVARQLGKRADPPAVIFVTAHEDFAVEAFDLEAVDYVLKPVAADRLERAIDRAVARRERVPDRRRRVAQRVLGPAPLGAAADRRRPGRPDRRRARLRRLHVGERSYLLLQTIAGLEGKLDPSRFLRIHRSTILRRDRIRGLRHEGPRGVERRARRRRGAAHRPHLLAQGQGDGRPLNAAGAPPSRETPLVTGPGARQPPAAPTCDSPASAYCDRDRARLAIALARVRRAQVRADRRLFMPQTSRAARSRRRSSCRWPSTPGEVEIAVVDADARGFVLGRDRHGEKRRRQGPARAIASSWYPPRQTSGCAAASGLLKAAAQEKE